MIKQEYIERKSHTVDEGEMGFHDYVTKYEPLQDFILRVTSIINESNEKFKEVQYISSGKDNEVTSAVIIYKVKK